MEVPAQQQQQLQEDADGNWAGPSTQQQQDEGAAASPSNAPMAMDTRSFASMDEQTFADLGRTEPLVTTELCQCSEHGVYTTASTPVTQLPVGKG